MKYERKSPFSDGFNDTYAGFGVDADDYWARKRMLLGSGGGGGSGGSSPGEVGPTGNDPDGVTGSGSSTGGTGGTGGSGGSGGGHTNSPDEVGPTGNDPDGVTGMGSTPGIGGPGNGGGSGSVPGDYSIGADPAMGQPGSGFGGISSGENDAANAEAEAEAAAIGAAMGESQAYANNIALSPVREALNFGLGFFGFNYGKEHDEFGRGIDNLSFSPFSAVASMMGLGPVGAIGVAGLEALGRGTGFNTSIGINEEGTVSFSAPGPGAIGDAVANAIGVDTSPGGISHGNNDVSFGGFSDAVSTGLGGASTNGPSSTAGLGGFGDDAGGDPALDVTNPYGILSLGQTIQERDLDVGGDAQTAGTAFPIVPINTTDVGTSGFNVVPTTRPFVNPPIRQPVTLQTPFFQQPNFQPFARPMRYGGAVHQGIGSMLRIR